MSDSSQLGFRYSIGRILPHFSCPPSIYRGCLYGSTWYLSNVHINYDKTGTGGSSTITSPFFSRSLFSARPAPMQKSADRRKLAEESLSSPTYHITLCTKNIKFTHAETQLCKTNQWPPILFNHTVKSLKSCTLNNVSGFTRSCGMWR